VVAARPLIVEKAGDRQWRANVTVLYGGALLYANALGFHGECSKFAPIGHGVAMNETGGDQHPSTPLVRHDAVGQDHASLYKAVEGLTHANFLEYLPPLGAGFGRGPTGRHRCLRRARGRTK